MNLTAQPFTVRVSFTIASSVLHSCALLQRELYEYPHLIDSISHNEGAPTKHAAVGKTRNVGHSNQGPQFGKTMDANALSCHSDMIVGFLQLPC